MPVTVRGIDGRSAERIRQWCERAAADLGIEPNFPVDVGGSPLAILAPPTGTPVGLGNKDGVWLHRWTASDAGAGDLYRGWVLYEEVAHHALARAGVPHEGLGDFMHEVFATWFQFDRWVNTGKVARAGWNLTTTPVLPGGQPQDLGKHLGAALAGHQCNREHLEQWLTGPEVTTGKRRAIEETERLLSPPLTATEVADAYRELMRDSEIANAWS